ncbi:CHASE2 domain-containing serine/threonine-protein kinase [Methyloversatilis sp.]|uniref:CHASE2 domain-containing serine/threonine-protein kinase n=2 Tax=Methyloversatilis sp. TaxID=2569862 RepID=UPI002732C3E8|nr:serine/threonine-protein kinase [Methyloversatilis sp.]MDP3456790.1 serine/threonine-protein kinase [Methyloversatilis sp.]MDP3576412.1 serine/threonine-protein kinase [Methyloversatilis sp.]
MSVAKAAVWKTDWFLGVIISLLFLFSTQTDLIQSLERKAYDVGVAATDRSPSPRIAIIAIDQQSIDNIGRWPWPRDVHARMIDKLAEAQAKVVGTTIFFAEPQLDPGLVYINRLLALEQQARDQIEIAAAVEPPAEGDVFVEPPAQAVNPLDVFGATLREAEAALNTDRQLADSMKKAGNVALPMLFLDGEPQGRPDKPLPEFVRATALTNVSGTEPLPPLTLDVSAGVIEQLGTVTAAVGHLNPSIDRDGGLRLHPLVMTHFDQLYPSLPLLIAAKSLNLGVSDIKVTLGESVSLARLNVATDPSLGMYSFYYRGEGGKPAFPVDSFFDVMSGKIPLDKYRDRIVLIGQTAPGIGNFYATPVSPAMSSVEVMAHGLSSILQEHFFVSPPWSVAAEFGVFLLVALYLIVLLPRLKAGLGAGVTAAIFVALLATHFVLMTSQLVWLQLMLPAALLLVGHLLLTTKRFLVTERGKVKSDEQSAESNRMLALAFQGQGQLDMAWDKFRQVPLSDAVMENLYNLALDFERKRQFNKAESVFRHMAEFNPKFRDLETRVKRAKAMSETVMLGGGGGGRTNTSILEDGTVEKPMLGRYQVEKELGKGAMGVVYLGRDPKINRVVAIKTMALSQEFDEEELADVKERFFREAETAGRLNHPNIVTIFDAGEEHDLAYIAMEFLKGRDLVPQTKPGQLLPLPKVMDVVARVAEALAYAHGNNVVHRDVKPANIMFEPESDQVKVTDFGIARITDSSRTKTGMVLGTPSYMSPEQLAGKKIDGRSDLFSLGVMLFQMVCGKLPFEGDSMAQLMFRIANEGHPDIRDIRPDVPDCLSAIIDRALAKEVEARYQSGGDMAADLRTCAGNLTQSITQVDFDI